MSISAIAILGRKPLIFPELCHSCGGCERICPTGAIQENPAPVGRIIKGRSGEIHFIQGELQIGNAMSPPIIRAVKKLINPDIPVIIDCPPGTSCPMITAVRGADMVLLVTEPTHFGLHNMKLAVETVKLLGITMGVIVNRAILKSGTLMISPGKRNSILLRIDENRLVAEAGSKGKPLVHALPAMKFVFAGLLGRLVNQPAHCLKMPRKAGRVS